MISFENLPVVSSTIVNVTQVAQFNWIESMHISLQLTSYNDKKLIHNNGAKIHIARNADIWDFKLTCIVRNFY